MATLQPGIAGGHRPPPSVAEPPPAGASRGGKARPPVTPDGRYIVVRGRLWRRADPGLAAERRAALTAELMDARRAVGAALRGGDAAALAAARARVDAAKTALGERGPVWWKDGTPDQNRRMARNTGYAGWFASLGDQS